MRRLILPVFLCGLLAFSTSCSERPTTVKKAPLPGGNKDPLRLRLAVIPKGTTHVFWKSVERGAKKAGEDLDIDIVWKGPITENDAAGQIQVVQQFTADGVSGIVLAPLDHQALVNPVKAAREKNIHVVIFDSALDGEAGKDFATFVATNNRQAGKLGGQHLAELLGGKGNVVLLRYLAGSASTDEREKGFLDAIAQNKEMKVLVDNKYAGATGEEAKTQALNLLDQIKEAQGVFCPNESSTFGMLIALRQSNLIGKVKLVGFDASPPLIEALRNGEIAALVVQDPTGMGYKAVQALADSIRGVKLEPIMDTGAVLVTKQNIETEQVKKLLE
ncbi:MAG: substrate-binding domain-containing protein [Pyrinomonadaceae bacterium]|nr:substrate-binding domain-containing protein [Phycisphaerales bacterium]